MTITFARQTSTCLYLCVHAGAGCNSSLWLSRLYQILAPSFCGVFSEVMPHLHMSKCCRSRFVTPPWFTIGVGGTLPMLCSSSSLSSSSMTMICGLLNFQSSRNSEENTGFPWKIGRQKLLMRSTGLYTDVAYHMI